MSELFPQLDRRLTRRLLRTGMRVPAGPGAHRETAEILASLGLVTLEYRRYVRCAHPTDEDYWQIPDRDCPGEIEIDDDGPHDCPECGRTVDYPTIRKEVFRDLTTTVQQRGVAEYLHRALGAANGVTHVARIGQIALTASLAGGREAVLPIVDYAGPGWQAGGSASGKAYVYVIASPINRPSADQLERAYHIELADVLANDRGWLAGVLYAAARPRRTAFISYSHNDASFVDRLAEDLVANGVGVWLDRWEIRAGESITDRIQQGLVESDYLLVVLSPDSVDSSWVREELSSAQLRQLESRHVVVLPVLYRDCTIPRLLRDKRYADFRGNRYKQGVQDLLAALSPTVDPGPLAPNYWGQRPPRTSDVRTEQTVDDDANLSWLLAFICDHYDEAELKALAFDLNVVYDELPSRGRRSKARDLISYLVRRGRLDELVGLLKEDRPDGTPRPAPKAPSMRTAPKFYALFVGISQYEHLLKLSKCTTDAKDLHELLAQNGYERAHMSLLLDEDATKSAISHRLDWLARRAGPNDTVLFFFSGHGAQRIGGFEAGEYLCPVEADWYNLRATAISNAEFNAALRAIPAGRVAVFLDACHSGGVGQARDAEASTKSGLSAEAYAELARGGGRVVIASCQPGEVSWELPGMRNGLFTHYLLSGLRGAAAGEDGVVRVTNLFDYVSQQVPRHKDQHPLMKCEIVANFAITIPEG
jgi:hypothetical protein